jgi:hypothetical protein
MRFFFPDSQDQVNPSFDFVTEEISPRIRQRDDRYAHEILNRQPYDGMLISKAMIDGYVENTGKYTSAQRNRLYREGARRFFRLHGMPQVALMGDCGAFNYAREPVPPWSVREVLQFYVLCGVDFGISVDHVIFAFERSNPEGEPEWRERQELTLELAADYLRECRAGQVGLVPVGVAQGWDARSYASAVSSLQSMGYDYVALGGMVPLKTHDIVSTLASVSECRKPTTRIHLLGISRLDALSEFMRFGVTSFDSTSPLRQAFKDADDNYYWPDGNLMAVRVPQVDANPLLKRRILAGQVNQDRARTLEQACLSALRSYGAHELSLDDAVQAVADYECVWNAGKQLAPLARRTLEGRPWESCRCGLCQALGVDIVVFRGSERNKRRGFHNLSIFSQRLRELTDPSNVSAAPANLKGQKCLTS